MESSELNMFFSIASEINLCAEDPFEEDQTVVLIKQKKDNTKTWNDNTKNKAVQQPSFQGELSQPTKSFLPAKEQSFSKDIQFLQAHVPNINTVNYYNKNMNMMK